jgi:hypothetical protein
MNEFINSAYISIIKAKTNRGTIAKYKFLFVRILIGLLLVLKRLSTSSKTNL